MENLIFAPLYCRQRRLVPKNKMLVCLPCTRYWRDTPKIYDIVVKFEALVSGDIGEAEKMSHNFKNQRAIFMRGAHCVCVRFFKYKMPFVIFWEHDVRSTARAAILHSSHSKVAKTSSIYIYIPHIVYETKMKPVIQFDKQFIIVIFLMLLCTQRIFGYDLSLLTVRGICSLSEWVSEWASLCMCMRMAYMPFNSSTFSVFFSCHMKKKYADRAFHLHSLNNSRPAQWRGNSIFSFLSSLFFSFFLWFFCIYVTI